MDCSKCEGEMKHKHVEFKVCNQCIELNLKDFNPSKVYKCDDCKNWNCAWHSFYTDEKLRCFDCALKQKTLREINRQ